jgi:hypothetical protein
MEWARSCAYLWRVHRARHCARGARREKYSLEYPKAQIAMNRSRIIIFGLVVIGVGLLGWSVLSSLKPLPEGAVRATLTIDFGNLETKAYHEIVPKTHRTAFGILEYVTAREEIALDADHTRAGVFVRKIGEQENGDDGRYWQYWVNDDFSLVGSGAYMLEEGDHIQWKFIEP